MADPVKKASGKDAETAAALGHCIGKACKTKPARFGFCEEHFEQYKFGLVNKVGEHVPDYDKKLEHYQAYKKKHKVA